MSSPVLTLREKSPAFEALIEMVSRSIHHLPAVDEGGTAVGVVTTTDLVRLENSNPVYLAADIGRQRTMAGVVDQARRIPRVLGQLVERDVSAAEVSRVVTALGDAVRRRVSHSPRPSWGTRPRPTPRSCSARSPVRRRRSPPTRTMRSCSPNPTTVSGSPGWPSGSAGSSWSADGHVVPAR